MDKKSKKLLINDLCARLPYGVIINVHDTFPYTILPYFNMFLTSFDSISSFIEPIFKTKDKIIRRVLKEHAEYLEFKPYLRPLSSMTEDEAKEIAILHDIKIKNILSVKVTSDYIDVIVDDGVCSTYKRTIWYNEIVSSVKCFDFLTSHHFDYRGLIEEGLALKAIEGMYNIK